MVGSIKDWPKLLKQAYTAVKPGGYIELLEPDSTLRSDDGSFPEDSALAEWGRLFTGGARGIGAPLDDTPKFSDYLRDAGFTDISREIFKLPNSPWAKDAHMKEVGGYQMAAFIEGLEALSLFFFTTVHGMSVPEIEILLAQVRKDMRNKAIHTYFNLFRYVARKPETA
ncbi:hypothetical protein TWF706_012012 [Orbilia oligospora]|nr:hypothetical protein TWF706_012012 [Orbilia oligospora]KAF3114981.1 hypothetical protein TWF706_012012 [Orbilia oligospora]